MFHPILLFTLLLPLASANAAQPIRLGLNYPAPAATSPKALN